MSSRALLFSNFPLFDYALLDIVRRIGHLVTFVDQTCKYDEVESIIQKHNPDLIIIHQSAIRKDIVYELEYFQQISPNSTLTFIVYSLNSLDLQSLMEQGLASCICQYEPLEAWIRALRTIVEGQTWYSQCLVRQLIDPSNSMSSLTEIELSILKLVVMDKTNQEIALILEISTRTVRNYLSSIYRKLGVSSKVAAAVKAVQRGIMPNHTLLN